MTNFITELENARLILVVVVPFLVVYVLTLEFESHLKETLAVIAILGIISLGAVHTVLVFFEFAETNNLFRLTMGLTALIGLKICGYDVMLRDYYKAKQIYIVCKGSGYLWRLGTLSRTRYPDLYESFELPGVGRVSVKETFTYIPNVPGIKVQKIQ